MPWPLALMEIADRGLINGSRLLRLKLFGLARSPAPPVSIMLSFAAFRYGQHYQDDRA
jgi:hypothetical protein